MLSLPTAMVVFMAAVKYVVKLWLRLMGLWHDSKFERSAIIGLCSRLTCRAMPALPFPLSVL